MGSPNERNRAGRAVKGRKAGAGGHFAKRATPAGWWRGRGGREEATFRGR